MNIFGIFLVGMGFGFFLEILFLYLFELIMHKPLRFHKRFSLGQRVSLMSLPIWGLLAVLIFTRNDSFIRLFIISAIAGTCFEFIIGYFFYKVFHIKIWTYKHGALGQFTSIVCIRGGGSQWTITHFLATYRKLRGRSVGVPPEITSNLHRCWLNVPT